MMRHIAASPRLQAIARPARRGAVAPVRAASPRQQQPAGAPSSSGQPLLAAQQQQRRPGTPATLPHLAALWAAAAAAAPAAQAADLSGGPPASSYYVSLGLFVMTVPGLWSLIKRAPKAKIKRKTFEVAGPADPSAMPLEQRARQVFDYFKKYNYQVVGRGEVITFEGTYAASASQAAALVLYTLIGLASTALVLSITVPQVGGWWYTMCAASPAAGWYYWNNAERTEQFKVKMVTSDDEATTDIVVEGDDEEIERFWKELGLREKGKVLVKGILEG